MELTRRKRGFTKKFGPNTIVRYDAEHRDENQLYQDLCGNDLFCPKKFIIIAGIPEDTCEDNKLSQSQVAFFENFLEKNQQNINPEHIIVFVSYQPDKRKKLYKWCKEVCETKEFPKLKKPELSKKIIERTEGVLQQEDAAYLIEKVGEDTGRLRNECSKIKARVASVAKDERKENANAPTNGKNLIDLVAFSTKESDPFGMIDVLLDDPHKACNLLDTMYANKDNRNQVMGTLLWGLRNMLLYLGCIQVGVKDPKEIANKINLHPFVISKLKAKEKKLTEKYEHIKAFFAHLLALDESIKTGKLPEVMFWVEVKREIIKLGTCL